MINIFKKKREYTFGLVFFEVGDIVNVKPFDKLPYVYKVKILDINARYVVPSIKSSWKVEYYVEFINESREGWFFESQISNIDIQKEREDKINMILNV